MAKRGTNAYEEMKRKGKKGSGSLDFKSALKQEETYFVGAAGAAILFAGLIDGGVSVALAYGAKKLYDKNNGK